MNSMNAYGSLCAEFYDLDKPSAPVDALAFYVDRARKSGGRVLEPMCGSGRFLLPMSLAGFSVDGVDSSLPMLAACSARAHRLGVEVRVFQQDLASLALPHRYSMAFIPSGSICLITDECELQLALLRLRAHLEPGAALLLEIVSDDIELTSPAELETRVVTCTDGSSITYTCVASRVASAELLCYSGTYTKRAGYRVVETETEELVLRPYAPSRLMAMLAACGFTVAKAADESDLTFLANSGCTLIEAIADA